MLRKARKALKAKVQAAYGATFVRRRSLTVMTLLLIVVYSIGFSTSFWLPLRLGYLLLFGVILAWIWNWMSTRGVRAQVHRIADRLQVGQTMVEFVEVQNTWHTPKLWIEVEIQSNLPEHKALHVASLKGGMRRRWRAETVCERRGHFTLGPVIVRGGDPFDLFHREEAHGEAHHVVVQPRPLALPHYSVPPANLPGEGRFRRRTHYVTPNASGIREYAAGDSVNRIHWPSTLRTSRIMVKTFELDPASNVWIVLDLDAAQHVGGGEVSTVEYAVTAAASVARLFLVQNRSVGLMLFGRELVEVSPNRGSQHLSRILDALAGAEPVSDVPLGTLLNEQAHSWGRDTTLIVITAATDPRWVMALRALSARGVKAAVILMHLESFGGRRGSEEMMAMALTSGIQLNLVRKGDYLPDVLGPSEKVRPGSNPAPVAPGVARL